MVVDLYAFREYQAKLTEHVLTGFALLNLLLITMPVGKREELEKDHAVSRRAFNAVGRVTACQKFKNKSGKVFFRE